LFVNVAQKFAPQYSIKKLGQDGEYLHFFDKKKFFLHPFITK
jgi:hypothetical protein